MRAPRWILAGFFLLAPCVEGRVVSFEDLPAPPPIRQARPVAADPRGSSAGGRELLRELRAATARNHKPRGYDDARVEMFSDADNVTAQGVRGVLESYSLIFVPGTSGNPQRYAEKGDENGDGHVDKDGMNIEHTWPQSFFGRRGPMRSDLHHLLPTFIHPNSVRGHLPFGEVEGRLDYSNAGGARAGSGRFEPPDAMKGRVARALLYFYARYGCDRITESPYQEAFWRGSLDTLLRWHREHPPGDAERERNDRVERFQGNRNPFVDDPSLADRIGREELLTPPGRCN